MPTSLKSKPSTGSATATGKAEGSPRPAPPPDSAPPPAAAPPPHGAPGADRPKRRRRRLVSPLTWRILSVNVLALAILVGGLLYLGKYREELVEASTAALATQARIFAGALGEGAVGTGASGAQQIHADVARPMLRRLVQPTGSRARLFDSDGALITDSRQLAGPGGTVQVEVLSPPGESGFGFTRLLDMYERLADRIAGAPEPPLYHESPVQHAQDYPEAMKAMAGETATEVREFADGRLVISAAVPVQRFKQVLGVLLLTSATTGIERAVRDVRIGILRIFLFALVVTVLLSLYLASTMARPVRRLAAAADRVRHGHRREAEIPDFTERRDEIGDLSGALRDMTETLWNRMDAIESFAADVAHEIKNPLTSLRSAVETAARVRDPDQQRRLMAIVLEDVQRLDRLITDISDASRLDAELSREHLEPVDVGKLVAALVEVRRATTSEQGPALRYEGTPDDSLAVAGVEDRLVQVFNNLINNALSFSPPDGTVVVRGARDGRTVVLMVEDDGPGIPEGSEESIFERFYSERPESEKFGTHSGLGLSISRQIVDAHGGTIRAENRIASDGSVRGARFVVRLPAR